MDKAFLIISGRPDGSFQVLPQYGEDNVFDQGNVSHAVVRDLLKYLDTIAQGRTNLTPEEETAMATEAGIEIAQPTPHIIRPSPRSIRTH